MHISRESIFVSAIRSFFNAFAVVVGISMALIIALFGLAFLSKTAVESPEKTDLTLSADVDGNRKQLADTVPVILRINIEGIIGAKNLNPTNFTNILLDSREGVLANNRVKGILLYVNTPGGLATDSSNIYRLLKDYKEKYHVPIYAYVEGICASGGMYISAAADKIFASDGSIIGSIGVRVGPVFNVATAMEKVGIKSLTLTEGLDKDALNPFRPWREGEDKSLKDIVEQEYETFVAVMTENRPRLNREKLIYDYGARIYSANISAELGYIDNGNASYNDALKDLVGAAGISPGEKYQVLLIAPHQSVFKELAQNKYEIFKGKLEHVFPIGPYMTSDMSGKLLFLYQP